MNLSDRGFTSKGFCWMLMKAQITDLRLFQDEYVACP